MIIGALLGGLAFTVWQEMNPQEEESELSFFHKSKESLYFWYADESMTDYISSAAVAYGEEHDVRVIPHLVEDSEYLEAINQASVSEGQVPDLYLISNDSLEKAYLAGLAAPIADGGLVSTENFPQTAIDAVTYQEKLVAYPLYFETSALIYNETFLEEWASQQAGNEATEAGVTYDEETLKVKAEGYMEAAVPGTMDDLLNLANTFDPPETVEGIFKWDVSDIFYNYYFVGNYLTVGGAAGDDRTICTINNSEVISCLEIYKNLNQFFYIESETVSYDSVVQDFLDGKTVFTIATTDIIKVLADAKAEGTFAYEYGAALLPDPSADLKAGSLSVTGAVAVNGYSEKKELANDFAIFLTEDYAANLYERADKLAASRNAGSRDEMQEVFYEEYSRSVSLPKMLETGNFWMQLEILFSKVWNGEDTTTVLSELDQQMQIQISAGRE